MMFQNKVTYFRQLSRRDMEQLSGPEIEATNLDCARAETAHNRPNSSPAQPLRSVSPSQSFGRYGLRAPGVDSEPTQRGRFDPRQTEDEVALLIEHINAKAKASRLDQTVIQKQHRMGTRESDFMHRPGGTRYIVNTIQTGR